jgi:hypothetical protein
VREDPLNSSIPGRYRGEPIVEAQAILGSKGKLGALNQQRDHGQHGHGTDEHAHQEEKISQCLSVLTLVVPAHGNHLGKCSRDTVLAKNKDASSS